MTMVNVTLDGNSKVTGIFALPQPQLSGYTQIDSADPRIAAFLNPPSAQAGTLLAAGINITSTGTPSISSTYALDPTTLDQIGSVARDAAAGLGLPGGLTTFVYPDINGVPKTFSSANIQAVYKAQRDFVFAAQTTAAILAQGGSAPWPSANVLIP